MIHNVSPTPDGHVALDWQCVWRMEGTAALAVTPTMATSGAAAQAGMVKTMAKTLKSKALRFHSHMSDMGSAVRWAGCYEGLQGGSSGGFLIKRS